MNPLQPPQVQQVPQPIAPLTPQKKAPTTPVKVSKLTGLPITPDKYTSIPITSPNTGIRRGSIWLSPNTTESKHGIYQVSRKRLRNLSSIDFKNQALDKNTDFKLQETSKKIKGAATLSNTYLGRSIVPGTRATQHAAGISKGKKKKMYNFFRDSIKNATKPEDRVIRMQVLAENIKTPTITHTSKRTGKASIRHDIKHQNDVERCFIAGLDLVKNGLNAV